MTGLGLGLTRREFGAAASAALAAGLAVPAYGARAAPRPFLLGADISWVPEDEAAGATYFENGIQRDPLTILRGVQREQTADPAFLDLYRTMADDYGLGRPLALSTSTGRRF